MAVVDEFRAFVLSLYLGQALIRLLPQRLTDERGLLPRMMQGRIQTLHTRLGMIGSADPCSHFRQGPIAFGLDQSGHRCGQIAHYASVQIRAQTLHIGRQRAFPSPGPLLAFFAGCCFETGCAGLVLYADDLLSH